MSIDPRIALACAVVAGLCMAGYALWTKHQLRNSRTRAQDDCDRICEAFDRLNNGDFSDTSLALDSDDMRGVESAYRAMVPSIKTTIEALEWEAQHDPLTKLFNSACFKQACQTQMADHTDNAQDDAEGEFQNITQSETARNGALLYLDINDFKKINDRLGHEAGDQFLIACAKRMQLAGSTYKSGKLAALESGQSVAGFEAIIGRLGGDEFGLFLPGNIGTEDVEKFVNKLQRLIGEPIQLGTHSVRAKISVGVAFSADHHGVYDKLLIAADTAMYESKELGGGHHCFYTASMSNKADQILEKELELRKAIQADQFLLHFQPQLNLKTNKVDCCEALIRWQHPERGLIMPGDFIPFAETHGIIDEIGDWVVYESIRIAAGWWAQGLKIRVAINISPRQLKRIELIPLIRAALKRYSLPAHALEIEITEAAVMQSDDIILERLEALRREGVVFALDDFGTGYSNIAQLLSLPIDTLKLDRSLLNSIETNRRQRMVIIAILKLAKKMKFNVLAEGVETESQLELLRKIGCHYAQGYLFARPLSEMDFTTFVTDWRKNTEADKAKVTMPKRARSA